MRRIALVSIPLALLAAAAAHPARAQSDTRWEPRAAPRGAQRRRRAVQRSDGLRRQPALQPERPAGASASRSIRSPATTSAPTKFLGLDLAGGDRLHHRRPGPGAPGSSGRSAAPERRLRWYWNARARLLSPDLEDVTGPVTGGGTFDIATDGGTEILPGWAPASGLRLGRSWNTEIGVRLDRHFTDWELTDRVSGRTGAIDDYTTAGLIIGAIRS